MLLKCAVLQMVAVIVLTSAVILLATSERVAGIRALPAVTQSVKATSPKEPQNKHQADVVQQPRARDIEQARDFASTALGFQEIRAKVRTLVRLADTLWAADEEFSRYLVSTAIQSLKASDVEPDLARELQREINRVIAAHDSAWAKRLVDNLTTDVTGEEDAASQNRMRAQASVGIASSLIEQYPEKASQMAETSLSYGYSRDFISFLHRLYLTDAALADKLFLRSLIALEIKPTVDINEMLALGTYVFTFAQADAGSLFGTIVDPGKSRVILMTRVGNVPTVSVWAERPDVSPDLVRAFLNVAVNLLLRASVDPQRHDLCYVAAYQLEGKVKKFLPGRQIEFLHLMSTLSGLVPGELAEAKCYGNLSREKFLDVGDLSEAMERVDKASSSGRGDVERLNSISSLMLKQDYDAARSVALTVEDKDLRQSLLDVVWFQDGAKALREGELDRAEAIANGLSAPNARAVLLLAIAQENATKGKPEQAALIIGRALTLMPSVDANKRPYLLLLAAGIQVEVDKPQSRQTVIEAVERFNALSLKEVSSVSWNLKIEFKNTAREFSIRPPGMKYDIGQTLIPLLQSDLEQTLASLRRLKHEYLLGESLVASTRSLPMFRTTKARVAAK